MLPTPENSLGNRSSDALRRFGFISGYIFDQVLAAKVAPLFVGATTDASAEEVIDYENTR
ncbi:MAG TPA: hypothetical protein VF173_09255 [Thermoanaerobaculia bacterium]|nr:hypothetical protein [Thermoanaerobaculia bacterium]